MSEGVFSLQSEPVNLMKQGGKRFHTFIFWGVCAENWKCILDEKLVIGRKVDVSSFGRACRVHDVLKFVSTHFFNKYCNFDIIFVYSKTRKLTSFCWNLIPATSQVWRKFKTSPRSRSFSSTPLHQQLFSPIWKCRKTPWPTLTHLRGRWAMRPTTM